MSSRRNPALAFVCALALPAASFAQPADTPESTALARIRPEGIRAHMRFLADDLLEGRGTGSRGYELAAKYVAARFEALGLTPAGAAGGYFQPVPLLRIATVEPRCSLALLRDGKRTELKFGQDYFLFSSYLAAPDLEVTAPLVFAGFGVSAPELGYDDFRGLDVRGKIVVSLSGAPAALPQDQRAYYSSTQLKLDQAVARGAVGALGILTPADAKRLPWEMLQRVIKSPSYRWLRDDGLPYSARAQLRAIGVLSRTAAESLFTAAPHTLDEVFKAAEAGQPPAFALPVAASAHTVSERSRAASPNVAALLRGSDPTLRDEVVVLSAHLDHLGIGEPVAGDSIYNGAYDNASGVAALLEMANAFASLPVPPRRSLLFLAVTGEEQGLQGSEYFVHHATVPRDKIVADLNFDMFLMLYPLHDVVAYGAEHSSLGPLTEQAARRLGLAVSPDPAPEQVRFIRSDQFSFIREGIPSLFLSPGFQSDEPAGGGPAVLQWLQTTYHQPSDDMSQTFDFASGAKFVQLNFLIAYQAAQETAAPRWNPGDFFSARHAEPAP
jgi:Zn-dependent M28 family amino/carboxypeptidase